MEFPAGQTVLRDRRPQIPDRYNTDRTTEGAWDDAETIELHNAFVATTSSSAVPDAVRSQSVTLKSLYLGDPTADVAKGDRIRAGGVEYFIDTIPAADTNPFTGWQPVLEIVLKGTDG